MELSHDQKTAHDAILAFWQARTKPQLTLGGFAGSGKTTLLAEAVRTLWGNRKFRPSIAFCAFTGKASNVMREKLVRAGVLDPGIDYCGTIHGLIYLPVTDEKERVTGWARREAITQDLIVVDEASMVNRKIYDHLAEYRKPMLFIGDHGQLPPVGDSFNLMERPDIRLEKIHRQAEGDPIIKLSILARTEGRIPVGRHGEFVVKVRAEDPVVDRIKDLAGVMILCGRNATRVALNEKVRDRLGLDAETPVVGDRLICLRNLPKEGVFNGMLGTLKAIKASGSHWYRGEVDMDSAGIVYNGRMFRPQFGSQKVLMEYEGLEPKDIGPLWDYGYAMTVHKSQGSESSRVVLFEERMPMASDQDWARWLYTGITRAKERLVIVEEG